MLFQFRCTKSNKHVATGSGGSSEYPLNFSLHPKNLTYTIFNSYHFTIGIVTVFQMCFLYPSPPQKKIHCCPKNVAGCLYCTRFVSYLKLQVVHFFSTIVFVCWNTWHECFFCSSLLLALSDWYIYRRIRRRRYGDHKEQDSIAIAQ